MAFRRALRARLQRKHSEFVVADNGSELAGMGYAAMSESLEKTAVLHQLYVLPKYQRHGVVATCSRELETCFPIGTHAGGGGSRRTCTPLAFYRAHGFVEVRKTSSCGDEQSGIPALISKSVLS